MEGNLWKCGITTRLHTCAILMYFSISGKKPLSACICPIYTTGRDADMTENFLQNYALGTQTFPTTNLGNSTNIL